MATKFRRTPEGVTTFSPEQDEILKAEYLSMPIKSLARHIGKSHTGVRGRMRQLGLTIPKELAEQRKAASQRKVGHIPFNKGKRQTEYLSAEQIERCRKTCYQKGNIPANTGKDGDIKIRFNSKRKIYSVWIRLSLANWVKLHVYNFEKANGPVPKGYCVAFKDRDTLNCDLDNLELISREENMRRNTIHNLPQDLKEVLYTKAQLTRLINSELKKLDQ